MSENDLSTFTGRFEWFYVNRLIPWLRKQAGVVRASQNSLGERLGENSSTLGTWRRGLAEPDEFRLERIAQTAGEQDPPTVARWLKHGVGDPPWQPGPAHAKARGGSAAQPIVDPVSLFERTLAVLPAEAHEAREIVKFAIETLSKARKIGIATIAPIGVGLAVLMGGSGSARACLNPAQENQPFLPWTRPPRGLVTPFATASRRARVRARSRSHTSRVPA